MKLSKISLGIAAACGLAAAPAWALTAADYVPANAMQIFLSGATAQDATVGTLLSAQLCTAGSLTRYTATNQFVYICTPNTANIVTGGKTQLVVRKNSIGGSGQGVGPVNSGATLSFLDLSLITGTTCPATTATGTNTATTYACPDTAAVFSNGVSQIGISDVEPSFFGGPSTYANLKAEPLATVIFGLPVTNNVYKRLQAAQSLTVGATDSANIPTLTTAQVNSLFTQEGQSWNGLAGLTLDTDTSTVVNDLLRDDLVYVARRADTSGTQKTYEAVIARTPNGDSAAKSCYAAGKVFLSGPAAADNTAANTLCNGDTFAVNNSGSGQVVACLNRFNALGKGAVGTLTTESTSAAGWKHVRVNGRLPNYSNVKNGSWQFYGDATVNTRKPPNAPNTEHANFLTALKNRFALAAQAVAHASFGSTTTDDGRAGLMTLKSVDATNGQNPWTRVDPGTGDVDNCAAAIQSGF